MRLVKTNRGTTQQNSTTPMLRLVLYKGEVYRLPATSQGLRVLSGIAWVTLTGQDIFLEAGEKALFTLRGEIALASALSDVPLVLEVWGDKDLFTLN